MWLELTYKSTEQKMLVNMSMVQSVVRDVDNTMTILYYGQYADSEYSTDEVVETVEFIREKLMWK